MDDGVIVPLRCGKVRMSRVLFADDLMLFGEALVVNAQGIQMVLSHFSLISRLQVNARKSVVVFSGTRFDSGAIN